MPMEGAVHPDFSRQVHVIPAFDPPADWPNARSIDFGSRAPFACTWSAYDATNDQIHIYHEHYKADSLLRDHAEAIWRYEGCPHCMPDDLFGDAWHAWNAWCAEAEWRTEKRCIHCNDSGFARPIPAFTIADPEGLDQRKELSTSYCISSSVAYKARAATFDRLVNRMRPSKTGVPGLVIHDCCRMTIQEFERLTWDKNVKAELATKGPDHAHDTVRYVVYEWQKRGYVSTYEEHAV